ncbi:MAG: hypothetical protein RI942_2401 [Pseudomonadota bacterium]
MPNAERRTLNVEKGRSTRRIARYQPSGDSLFQAGAHTTRSCVRERAMDGLEAFRVNRLCSEAARLLSELNRQFTLRRMGQTLRI